MLFDTVDRVTEFASGQVTYCSLMSLDITQMISNNHYRVYYEINLAIIVIVYYFYYYFIITLNFSVISITITIIIIIFIDILD